MLAVDGGAPGRPERGPPGATGPGCSRVTGGHTRCHFMASDAMLFGSPRFRRRRHDPGLNRGRAGANARRRGDGGCGAQPSRKERTHRRAGPPPASCAVPRCAPCVAPWDAAGGLTGQAHSLATHRHPAYRVDAAGQGGPVSHWVRAAACVRWTLVAHRAGLAFWLLLAGTSHCKTQSWLGFHLCSAGALRDREPRKAQVRGVARMPTSSPPRRIFATGSLAHAFVSASSSPPPPPNTATTAQFQAQTSRTGACSDHPAPVPRVPIASERLRQSSSAAPLL